MGGVNTAQLAAGVREIATIFDDGHVACQVRREVLIAAAERLDELNAAIAAHRAGAVDRSPELDQLDMELWLQLAH
jgi:hypothetical protein